ncbi:hypothetical protein EG328_011031 [Venturia inaequalis]|uniref:Mannan endo-1,6-alpha-mannosidase n=1 Tax=Venturia inaequalis TaxID=5025 RepID=A0A8H3U662_VENIN|nr:hypothetical protein EG328_011031 [Venturia inaequalis]KAE9969232.1 hypothetical protein EG327_010710 [Venturia inaequalis]
MRLHEVIAYLGAITLSGVLAIDLDINSQDSIRSAAKTVVNGVLSNYTGDQLGEIPGLFPSPYYWWSAGQVWDSLIDYWFLTGDQSHNNILSQALTWQASPDLNYMPPNQTRTLGNDDQSSWGLAAMTAAERSFPPMSAIGSYLTLAQNVFDTQVARWDDSTCAGGLRWQIYTFNSGYNYKNSLSNGQFMALSARLYRFTGNKTYADWAEKAYTWSATVGLISSQGSVYDGCDVTKNCSTSNHVQWTSNAGTYLYGSAVMYNFTSRNKNWQDRTNLLLAQITKTFASNSTKVLYEQACEPTGRCDIDQFFFKGMLARDLARTAQIAPFTAETINPILQESAKAAASVACTDGTKCFASWREEVPGSGDQDHTLGSQFSALQIIQQNLVGPGKALAAQNGTASTPISGGSASLRKYLSFEYEFGFHVCSTEGDKKRWISCPEVLENQQG